MGGMWGFLGAFCVPWDDPTCPGDTQYYPIQKWEGPRTFCPCPHFTEWRPRGSSRLPGHRALTCGRAEARSQDPSHHISLHSHLPKTQPVPWPPGESGPLARPPAQMNLLQPRGLQPQGGPSPARAAAIILIRPGHHCPKDKRMTFCVKKKHSPGIISESTHLGGHTSKTLILLGDPSCRGRDSFQRLSGSDLDFKN